MNIRDAVSAQDAIGAAVALSVGLDETIDAPHFIYTFECRDSDGNLKWVDGFKNLVTTGGKNDFLDKYFAGSAYTAAWSLGLVSTGSFTAFAVGDTMASHAGWLESVAYSNSTRVTLAFSAASAGSKSTSSGAVFNINATDTIQGAFTTTVSTKSGTTGILYSGGSFGSTRSVLSGDTLTVSATLSC